MASMNKWVGSLLGGLIVVVVMLLASLLNAVFEKPVVVHPHWVITTPSVTNSHKGK